MGPELGEGHGEGGAGSICGLCRFGVCGKDAEDGEYPGRAFFLTEKNANYRQALDQQLALKKQALSPVLEISDTAFIIRMLEKNHGLSFLPYLAVERDIRKGRIALYMWKMWRYPCTGRSFTIRISLRRERWRSLSVWRQSESQSL